MFHTIIVEKGGHIHSKRILTKGRHSDETKWHLQPEFHQWL